MKLIDLSQPLQEDSPGNPDYPRPKIEQIMQRDKDRWLTELVTVSIHSGTHIDAPNHKLEHWKGLEHFPLDHFMGKAVLADFRGIDSCTQISQADLHAPGDRGTPQQCPLLHLGGALAARTENPGHRHRPLVDWRPLRSR